MSQGVISNTKGSVQDDDSPEEDTLIPSLSWATQYHVSSCPFSLPVNILKAPIDEDWWQCLTESSSITRHHLPEVKQKPERVSHTLLVKSRLVVRLSCCLGPWRSYSCCFPSTVSQKNIATTQWQICKLLQVQSPSMWPSPRAPFQPHQWATGVVTPHKSIN